MKNLTFLVATGLVIVCLAGCADNGEAERRRELLGAAAEAEGAREGAALAAQMKSTRADGQ